MFSFPDLDKAFNMYTTLVEQFKVKGHDIIVLAPGNDSTTISIEAGIEILRVKALPIKNVPNYLKGLSNILLPIQFNRALNKYYPSKRIDLIISATPPITFANLIEKLKKSFQCTFYLILRDIFPQNAVDLKIIKKRSFFYRYFRKLEVKLYKNADFIGCMSQRNVDYILENNSVSKDKLHILSNFQKKFNLDNSINSLLKTKYGIDQKFVAVFGGNIGKAQKIENILELAKRCDSYKDVLFLILGEGIQKKYLDRLIRIKKLNNIKTINTIPKQEYQELLRLCDIGLISLHEDFTIPNIPSKTLDYFNLGMPVLASIDAATDYGKILEEAGAGFWSLSGDHEKFKENFDLLYFDVQKRREMGLCGRVYFEKYLTPEIAYKTIISALKNNICH